MSPLKSSVVPRISHEVLLSLLNKPVYREKWMKHVQRRRGDSISQRAVTNFIAYELSDRTAQDIDPDTIKDRVSRALTGESLTDSTALMFITAFGFNHREADELQRAISFHRIGRKVAQPVADNEKDPLSIGSSQDYTSLSTLVEIDIDPFGLMKSSTVTEVIRSEVDSLNEITPRFAIWQHKTEVLEGGELVRIQQDDSARPLHKENTIWQLSVRPPFPLAKGDIHQLRFRINFDTDLFLQEAAPQDTLVMGPFSPARFNITIALNFDALPTGVRRKIWSSTADGKDLIEDTAVKPQLYDSITYPLAEDTVFSYAWDTHVTEAIEHYHGNDPHWLDKINQTAARKGGSEHG